MNICEYRRIAGCVSLLSAHEREQHGRNDRVRLTPPWITARASVGGRFCRPLHSLVWLKAEGIEVSIVLGRGTGLRSATAKTHREAVMDL